MTPHLCTSVTELRTICDTARAGGSVAFVPTMGALHAGHASLIREAKQHGSVVVVSIFVNPTQFGPSEDLQRYPRDLEGDFQHCRALGVDVVFAPSVEELYAGGDRTRVRVTELGEFLCGASRPGHFEGVATVVTKLFAAVGSCTAVFGRKDYQQLAIVRQLVGDLLLPVRIVDCATVREHDGLALSSRNRALSEVERRNARAIPRALSTAIRHYDAGERSVTHLRGLVERELLASNLKLDYVALADPERLFLLEDEHLAQGQVLLAVAVHCGSTRLIDNVVLGVDSPPYEGQS